MLDSTSLVLALALLGGLTACGGSDSTPVDADAAPSAGGGPDQGAAHNGGSAPGDPAPKALVARDQVPADFNLLLITIDTLRADHLGCYGYFRDTSPTIDALAEESLVFERCLAPVATTLPSHTSMMTGTAPHEHGVLSNIEGKLIYERAPHLSTLAEFLTQAGRRTGAVVSAFPLDPHFGLDSGFKFYRHPSGNSASAKESTDIARKWLSRDRSEPFFFWLHYFDPHTPYTAPDEYQALFQSGPELEEWKAARDVAPVAQYRRGRKGRADELLNGYDAEVRYTDAQLARVFETLREQDLWDNTVIVLLADHGEGLNQHELPGHGWIWDEQLHVPFMIRVPGLAPQRSSSIVTVADLVPTLFHLFDWPEEQDFLAQVSGLDGLAPGTQRAVLSQSSPAVDGASQALTYTLTTKEHKYVRGPQGTEELYQLESDPFQLSDLASEQPDLVEGFRSQLEEILARQLQGEAQTRDATSEEEASLRALGYGGDDDEEED